MTAAEVKGEESLDGAAGGVAKRAYVRHIFTEIAPRYDLLNHLLSGNVDRRWRDEAIRSLDWERAPHGVYVDLCAGTMDVAAQLAAGRSFAGQVVAADFAEPMLRAGAAKVRGRAVLPIVGDVQQLPLSDHSAIGAVVAFGIRNVADLDAALAEARRILQPGGRLVILEFSMPRARLLGATYRFYFRRVLPVIGRLLSGHPTAYRYLPESVASFPRAHELAARMRRAGFAKVVWRSLSGGIAAVHTGDLPS